MIYFLIVVLVIVFALKSSVIKGLIGETIIKIVIGRNSAD